jgi:ClpP class serine protease
MAIKRKILDYKTFKKGKNTLENPEKHPIKEGLNENHYNLDFKQYITIDEMIKKLESIKAEHEGKEITLRIDSGDYIVV